MKAVISVIRTKEEFIRVMRRVEHLGIVLDMDPTLSEVKEDVAHIFIRHQKKIYKFNRFDPLFIKAVEDAIASSPYLQYEGPLDIVNIDERFTHPRYYKINKMCDNKLSFITETFAVNKDQIIDDLYNNSLQTL